MGWVVRVYGMDEERRGIEVEEMRTDARVWSRRSWGWGEWMKSADGRIGS